MQVVIWCVRASLWTRRFLTTRTNSRGGNGGWSTVRAQNLLSRNSGRLVGKQCNLCINIIELRLLLKHWSRTFRNKNTFFESISLMFLDYSRFSNLLSHESPKQDSGNKVNSTLDLWVCKDFCHLPLVSFTTPPQFLHSHDCNRCGATY